MNVTPTRPDAPDTYRISDLPVRLASKITVDPASGCWRFEAGSNGRGYVQTWWNGRLVVAHRVVYELLVEPIPDELVIDHVKARGCINTNCCWPAHLEPVTIRVNVLRGYYPNEEAGDDRCLHGHLWSENEMRGKRGRYCRSCRQAYERTRPPRKRNRSRKEPVR